MDSPGSETENYNDFDKLFSDNSDSKNTSTSSKDHGGYSDDDDEREDSASSENSYICYPLWLFEKQHLEDGDKILMPPSVLNRLAFFDIEFPMLFELRNPKTDRVSHCGVMEFTAEEGALVLPQWMMENMKLQEKDTVNVRNVTLSKAIYVKLQPHSKDFLDVLNPKAFLERALRKFTCLTTGDTIVLPYNDKDYYIDSLETKPNNAVSLFETDCEVDFAAPLDYVEPVKPVPVVEPSVKPPSEKEATNFCLFKGVGRRLDGKRCAMEVPELSPILKSAKQDPTNGCPAIRARSGKVVFGSGAGPSQKVVPDIIGAKDSNAETEKEEEKKFKPFTGKGYSLKD